VDAQRVLKSAVFPGMGQLGDGQIAEGLGFMAGEAVLLSIMFGQLAKSSAYALETKRDSILYVMGGDYQDVQRTYRQWDDAYEFSTKSRTNGFIFGGCAVAWWALNVVHAVLFAPSAPASQDEETFRDVIFKRTSIALTDKGAGLVYTMEF
jgi:hypothetical protein